uniref:Regulating synaptic membrane exocytosis 2 n=1 Tax=Eptatretus burgeri TaxID=7764 RepID=A0A8C4NK22_EPTBU
MSVHPGPDMPGLEHLTDEERRIIMGVMERQRQEDEHEQEILRKLHNQFEAYKEEIRRMGDEPKPPEEDGDGDRGESVTCGICRRSKFANGCGRTCTYCRVTFCPRCGGRVSLRSSKVTWVCNLCRKQQDILTQSGAWFSGEEELQDGPALEQQEVPGMMPIVGGRPCKGRHTRKVLSHDGSVMVPQPEVAVADRLRSSASRSKRNTTMDEHPTHVLARKTAERQSKQPNGRPESCRKAWQAVEHNVSSTLEERLDCCDKELQNRYCSDPNLARYPVTLQPYEHQMRIQAQVSRARHERRHSDASIPLTELSDGLESAPEGPMRVSRPSVRWSEPWTTPGKEHGTLARTRSSGHSQATGNSPPKRHRTLPSTGRLDACPAVRNLYPTPRLSAKYQDEVQGGRSASMSSDLPEGGQLAVEHAICGKYSRHRSTSSTEESPSTPEYSSCPDEEPEIEGISDRDKDAYLRGKWHSSFSELTHSSAPVVWTPSQEGDRLLGRMVLNKRLKDGTMPHDSGVVLGLKVVGGRMTEGGRLGAFITKVKKGSLAEIVGRLQAGDEVLEWNGQSLQGASFEDVYDIILQSKTAPQVELLVSRLLRDSVKTSEASQRHRESSSSSFESTKMEQLSASITSLTGSGTLQDVPQILPGNLTKRYRARRRSRTPRLKVRLCCDDGEQQLVVTVIAATDLPSRVDGRLCNPYVKLYLLPDRSEASKRRTKTLRKTLEPQWGQTFVFGLARWSEVNDRMLELTLWDQTRVHDQESHFLGEVLIELQTALLDDEPHSYKLQTHNSSSLPLPKQSPYLPRRSPMSDKRLQRSARISEDEVSDYDSEDGVGVVASARRYNYKGAKAASLAVPEASSSLARRSRSISPHPADKMATSQTWSPVVLQRSTDQNQAPIHTHRVGAPHVVESPCTDHGPSTTQNVFLHHPGRPLFSNCGILTNGTKEPDSCRCPDGSCSSSWLGNSSILGHGRGRGRMNHQSSVGLDTSSGTPAGGRRGRQLPQVPAKSSSERVLPALADVEERKQQMMMKMNKYQQCKGSLSADGEPIQQYKVFRERRLGSDVVSRKSSDSDVSDLSAASQASSLSRLSNTTYLSVQSERPRGTRNIRPLPRAKTLAKPELGDRDEQNGQQDPGQGIKANGVPEVPAQLDGLPRHGSENDVSLFMSKMQSRQAGLSGHSVPKSSSVSGDMYGSERHDGSQSDTGLGGEGSAKLRRSSFGAKVVAIVGLSRRSHSTSQLSQTDAGNRKARSAVRRSTETGMAIEMRNWMSQQTSRSSAESSINSYCSEGNLIFPSIRLEQDRQFSMFLDGLGPGQLVGRQTLATTPLGDIQLGVQTRNGTIEVEVIKARGLIPKTGSKTIPAPYVKVYLLENGVCIAKRKTKIANKSLDPTYEQQLVFEEGPQGKVLQVIVWGDYGRMDHKSFMGVVQIFLGDMDLSRTVRGWYKLFPTSSLVDSTFPPLTRRPSQTSLESSTGPGFARS